MIIEEKNADNFNCCQRTKQTTKPCEGSRCMAWRWVNPLDDEYKYLFDEVPDREKTYGYCGLAGKP